MTVKMFRQVIQCKQKKWRWPTWDSPLANWAKIVFKIKKDYLRIIFFLMAITDHCFKQVHNVQDSENNNWLNLEFIWNNTETSREIIPHKTVFVRVLLKQYLHFRGATINTTHISQSSHHTIHFQGVTTK